MASCRFPEVPHLHHQLIRMFLKPIVLQQKKTEKGNKKGSSSLAFPLIQYSL